MEKNKYLWAILSCVMLLNSSYFCFAQYPLFYLLSCQEETGCYYMQLPSSYDRCQTGPNSTAKFYAIHPEGVIPGPCSNISTTTFQWYRMFKGLELCGPNYQYCYVEYGKPIYGETDNELYITTGGELYCVYSCSGSTYYSDTVSVSYYSDVPSIYTQPTDEEVCEGTTASFYCDIYYQSFSVWQWSPDGTTMYNSVSGTQGLETYEFSADYSKNGYYYRFYAKNACGSVYSDPVTLTVLQEPYNISHPSNTTVCEDATANFNASAFGDGLQYNWQVSTDGEPFADLDEQSPYSGTNTPDLQVSPAEADKHGSIYRCQIIGSCASENTSFATLYLNFKPDITVNPVPQVKCVGESVTFSVTATGTGPIHYRWRKGGSTITGAPDQNTYTIQNVNVGDDGNYDCVVTNACNPDGVDSEDAHLTVKTLPAIETEPSDVVICEGESPSIKFTTAASGSDLSYQWQLSENDGDNWTDLLDNIPYSGTSTNELTISNPLGSMNQGLYRLLVNGYCDPDESSRSALLTVNTPPTIDMAPQPVTVCLGSDIVLNVSVSGTNPQYLWRKNETSLTGWVGSPTYNILGAGQEDAGAYDVLVKNVCTDPSSIESDNATVTVNIPPTINAQPQDKILCEDSQTPVIFSTSVPGTGLTYQWESSSDNQQTWSDLSDDVTFSGVTTDELTVASADDSLDHYIFRCKIIGICEPPVTTDAATLTIKTGPEFIAHPQAAEICQGEDVTFSVEVTGTEPFEYRWRIDDASIGNWTTENNYSIYSVTTDDIAQYSVMVKNECNTSGDESDKARLDVNPSPPVSLGSDRHVCTGESTILDPGSTYEAYNWSTGETTQSIEVDIQGNYKVTVTDTNGCHNSDNIYIFLDPLLPVIDLGADRRYCSGDDVTLDAGSGFDGYTWNDGSTSQTLPVYTTNKYYVTATGIHTVCISTDTVNILVAEPYDQEKICLITVDLLSGRNLIIWEKSADMGILSYRIYRQTSVAGEYELLETIPYENMSIFKDEEADPEIRQWVYKITAVDSCGNESDIKGSPYHRPLFLEYNGADDGVNLRWEPYVVEGAEMEFLTYEIYRGSDSSALSYLNEISGDLKVYKDTDPNALKFKYFYRVAGVKSSPCYPSLKKKADNVYSHSMSNIEDNRLQNSAANHSPTDLILDNLEIDENLPELSLVGRFTATDQDTADSHLFILVSGEGDTDNASFIIAGDSLMCAEPFDFESQSSCSIRVQCMDNGTDSLTFEKSFTITINNVIESGFKDVYMTNMNIYPNPFTHSTTIQFTNPDNSRYNLLVYDVSGKLVYTERYIFTDHVEFSREQLPAGLYIVELRGNRIYRGRMVIE